MAATNAKPQNLPQTSLYVGDLHPLVTESLLYATFSNVGHVLSARVCRDVAFHTSLGYGYVNFENPKDAERALENLNYEDLLGRQVRIMWCQRDPSLRKSGRGNIFIKNLDKNIAQKDLYDTFGHFGKILSCKIAMDENGHSKGYGFIHFANEEDAKVAIKKVDGKMINDRIVYVGPFIPRSERKSAGGRSKFTNCYVKNFSEEITDQEFHTMFGEYGEIKSACVMRDADGKSRGFGFVCFAEPDSAEAACTAMHNKVLNGQTMYCQRAQRKSERQEVLRQQFEKQRAERLSKYAAGVNLYVKNLDDSIDDARLKDAFGPFGKITSAKVMTDAVGHSKGFGFVCFTTAEEAKEAVNMNGNLLGSKPLYVALAQRREDRRAKLFAEHQQRIQCRANIGSMPATHSLTNFFGQPTFGPTQRFFHAPGLQSQPRWNRPAMAPQVQLTHAGIGAATALRPTMGAPYVAANSGAMAMSQGQMAAQNSAMAVPQQYRNQAAAAAAARNIGSLQPPAGMNAAALAPNAAAAGMIAPGAGGPHQQFNGQRNMQQQQMVGAANVPRAPMGGVPAGVRPASGNQIQRQMMQPNVQGSAAAANVRFNQTARNLTAQPPAGAGAGQRPAAGAVPIRPGAVVDQPFLSGLNENERKQYIGEQIFKKIAKITPDKAGKITGMVIGMETSELLHLLESDEALHAKVEEGMTVLRAREEAAAGAAAVPTESAGADAAKANADGAKQ